MLKFVKQIEVELAFVKEGNRPYQQVRNGRELVHSA